MWEYDVYRGVYCGVCRALGRRYGLRSRLLLTYDSVFYALLLLARKPQCAGFDKGRCVVNPFKSCLFCQDQEAAGQAAALCVLLAVQKLRDDRKDRGKGRTRARFLLPLMKRPYRKAAADYPWMEASIRRGMEAQAAVEAQPGASLDACAEPTAAMLGQVLAHESGAGEREPLTRVLQQTGYFLGRWVYVMDAADDMEKDAQSGDFNWFVRAFSQKPAFRQMHRLIFHWPASWRRFNCWKAMAFPPFCPTLWNAACPRCSVSRFFVRMPKRRRNK